MNKDLLETGISELNAGLHELETFCGVFDDFARNSSYTQHLDYINGVVSCLAVQLAKIEKIITVGEQLEKEICYNDG